MNTSVLLREKSEMVEVAIKELKLSMSNSIRDKWQKSIDLLVEIAGIKAALLMQITEDNMEVFIKSSNSENPYPSDGKDSLGHGLYCETVIGTNAELYVPNSLNDNKWKDNPDVKLNMISYLGYPIRFPDGSFFGTICVLDDQTMERDERIVKWMLATRDMIEADLRLVVEKDVLEIEANHDFLTGLPNRKALFSYLDMVHADFKRGLYHYGLAMIDIKHFKKVNDEYGHEVGDEVLRALAKVAQNRIRSNDLFARLGGDEFVLVAKNITCDNMLNLIKDIEEGVSNDALLSQYNITLSRGCVSSNKSHANYHEVLKEADQIMYENKNNS